LKEEGEEDDGYFDWIPYLSTMRDIQIKKRRKQLEKERKEMEKEQKKLAKKNKKEKKEQQKEQQKEKRSSSSLLPKEKGMSNDNIDQKSDENLQKSKSEGFIGDNNDDKQSSRDSIISSKSRSKGLKSRIRSLLDFKSKKNPK